MVIVVFLASLWWGLFLSGWFQAKNIEVRGTVTVNPQEIRNLIYSQLRVCCFLFEENNLFIAWLKRGSIKKTIKENFPIFKRVQITPLFYKDHIQAKLQERKELGIWSKGGQSFYFDHTGFLFRKAPSYKGAGLVVVKDRREGKIALASTVGPPEVLESVLALTESDYLDSLNLKTIEIQKMGQDLKAQFLDGWDAFFNVADPEHINSQIKVLQTTMENKIKEKKNQLQYIDLRVENRAYIQYEE